MNYRKSYIMLFNAITEAIEQLVQSCTKTDDVYAGIDTLMLAQQTTEDMYINNS